jgi:hypothetical protein
MKATLEFDMDDIDDRVSHMRAVKSLDMAAVLFEIQHNLRKKCSRILDDMDDNLDKHDSLNVIFTEIFKIIEEHNINTDELIQ